ncbi:hypothetical protein OH738_10175 [Streptomyces hirsutus]|uniref:Uncharacterized protein n=1 Tax=Streptomyces hirsutus TaxID=35620 RepID=A0ABZ1GW68_9ACTN|nr:hypothetical protein [Streptomyces hirsutus]WSD09441.1 hypothetical protein OIE73_29290 [Streptomyces hirsutus]WTD17107.1 hypothetical protein OH738_10175 [Streptomyces hirsutus]
MRVPERSPGHPLTCGDGVFYKPSPDHEPEQHHPDDHHHDQQQHLALRAERGSAAIPDDLLAPQRDLYAAETAARNPSGADQGEVDWWEWQRRLTEAVLDHPYWRAFSGAALVKERSRLKQAAKLPPAGQ